MTPTDLHAAVHTAVTTRLELARAATSGDWYVHEEPVDGESWFMFWVHSTTCGGVTHDFDGGHGVGIERVSDENGRADAEHIAANDPAATIRACEADLERLAAHNPAADIIAMHWGGCPCAYGKACPELLRMAKVYAITIEPDERAAISRQWATDWNSPNDTTYDQPEWHDMWRQWIEAAEDRLARHATAHTATTRRPT